MNEAHPERDDSPAREVLRRRFPHRLDISLSLALSAVLLGAGLVMPVLHVEKLWVFTQTVSIASGIATLVRTGSFGLAGVLVVFSVIFPTAKLVALSWIWIAALTPGERERWLHRLAILGKWSMLDVFVVAVLVVAVKLGALAQAEPRLGVYVFAASILLSMEVTTQIERLSGHTPEPSSRYFIS